MLNFTQPQLITLQKEKRKKGRKEGREAEKKGSSKIKIKHVRSNQPEFISRAMPVTGTQCHLL